MIRINEDPNGLKDSESGKKNSLSEFKRPLSSDCNGYGSADENNISIQPEFENVAINISVYSGI